MFGVSFPEILTVMFIILILFGPDKLPEMAKKVGKFMGELNRTTRGVRREFYNALYAPGDEFDRSIGRELKAVKSEIESINKTTLAEPKTEKGNEAEKKG